MDEFIESKGSDPDSVFFNGLIRIRGLDTDPDPAIRTHFLPVYRCASKLPYSHGFYFNWMVSRYIVRACGMKQGLPSPHKN